MVTKEDIFKKYSINESHSTWQNHIDNWMSVELFRVMHNGRLPTQDDKSSLYVLEFRDKLKSDIKFAEEISCRKDFGSLYLTSKRMTYRFADLILNELNEPCPCCEGQGWFVDVADGEEKGCMTCCGSGKTYSL